MDFRRLAGMLVAWVGLMLNIGLCRAESWENAFLVRASTEYETNPAMVPAYRGDGIWRLLVAPGYTLTRASDANELKTGLGLIVERSSNTSLSQNREDPSAFLDWRHHGEKGELGMTARYDEAATRFTELERAGPISADGTRASRAISVNGSRALSERSTLALDGGYAKITYKGGTFVDYTTKSGGIRFNYAWSERSAPFVKISYADYAPAGSGLIDRLNSAMLGLDWKASDRLDFILQAGKARAANATSHIYKVGGPAMRYTGQLAKLALTAERSVSTSGLGGFIIANQVTGNWSYDMGELSRIGINVIWRRSDFGAHRYLYRSTGPWLERDLNPKWRMRIYYFRNNSKEYGIYNASSDVFGFSLSTPLPEPTTPNP